MTKTKKTILIIVGAAVICCIVYILISTMTTLLPNPFFSANESESDNEDDEVVYFNDNLKPEVFVVGENPFLNNFSITYMESFDADLIYKSDAETKILVDVRAELTDEDYKIINEDIKDKKYALLYIGEKMDEKYPDIRESGVKYPQGDLGCAIYYKANSYVRTAGFWNENNEALEADEKAKLLSNTVTLLLETMTEAMAGKY